MFYNLIKNLVDSEMSTVFSQSSHLANTTPVSLTQFSDSEDSDGHPDFGTLDIKPPAATDSPSTFYFIKMLFFHRYPNCKSAPFPIRELHIQGYS